MSKQTLRLSVMALVVGLASCTDLKPLEKEIANLKAQMTRLQSDTQAAHRAAEQAEGSAASASQAAAGAQSTANQAVAAAQSSHACCDTTNEKVDRMFRRSVAK